MSEIASAFYPDSIYLHAIEEDNVEQPVTPLDIERYKAVCRGVLWAAEVVGFPQLLGANPHREHRDRFKEVEFSPHIHRFDVTDQTEEVRADGGSASLSLTGTVLLKGRRVPPRRSFDYNSLELMLHAQATRGYENFRTTSILPNLGVTLELFDEDGQQIANEKRGAFLPVEAVKKYLGGSRKLQTLEGDLKLDGTIDDLELSLKMIRESKQIKEIRRKQEEKRAAHRALEKARELYAQQHPILNRFRIGRP